MKPHSYHSLHAPIEPKRGFRIHLLVFAIVTPAIWVVWYLTDRSYPWPLWSTPAWGVGIVFHYLGAYVLKKSAKNNI